MDKFYAFLGGLGVGALIGVLYAPRSGEETRNFIAQKAQDSKEYVSRQAADLSQRANDLVERGKAVVGQQKDRFNEAVDRGTQAYREAL